MQLAPGAILTDSRGPTSADGCCGIKQARRPAWRLHKLKEMEIEGGKAPGLECGGGLPSHREGPWGDRHRRLAAPGPDGGVPYPSDCAHKPKPWVSGRIF